MSGCESTSHATRLSGMKQELQDFKNEFSAALSKLSNDVNGNLNTINEKLSFIDHSIAKKVNDSLNESILNIRDSIINALKDENAVLKNRVDDLEEKKKD